jgi:hypothetical protein
MKIIELKLSEEGNGEGITAISLVKHPAIEQNWIAFSENGGEAKPNPEFAFKMIDEEQRIVAGPAMVPDKLIVRMDNEGEEFFVFFKAETIRTLSERFLLQGRQNNMTLEHEATLNDLSVVESWIVEDPKRDKSTIYNFDLPTGSWFVKIKVLNDEIWQLVKNKSVEGFSVEGVFAQELIKQSKEMKKEKVSKLDVYLSKIKGLFSEEPETVEEEPEKVEEKFGTVTATNTEGAEIVISFEGESLEVGSAITHDVEGEALPVPTGEYSLPDGLTLIVTEEGVVGELKEATEEETPEEMEHDGLKAEQIDKLVEGIASIISEFKSEVKKEIETAVAESATSLREEFNKPADEIVIETPEKDEKTAIVKGLNKFVKEATNK